ncbi:MAG: SMC-Scp complex subunit ScpB [Candidatus Omnitrophica bacterium]|nr:SMC-Scp complex subunit ScpB [Candidatus Omnitrophota bacterium]
MDQSQLDHLRGAVEALLFVSEKPVTVDQLKEAVAGSLAADIKAVLQQLKDEYDNSPRGMTVIEIAGGWQMLSSPSFAEYIREFYKTRHKEKLSRAALECLAIIAYKQPVSRTDVELIRGVNSDGTVMHLLNKGLIKIAGRKEVPGRPYVYGTTNLFLEFFGLRSLEDLPKLEEFPALMPVNEVGVAAPEVVSDALVAAPAEVTPVTATEAREELARVQTSIDIEAIEQVAETDLGESSGQARLMSEAEAVPTDIAPEGDENGSKPAASEN